MARTTATIENNILNAIAADSTLSGLNSTSAVAIYRLWAYYIAANQAYEEQLNDLMVANIEATALKLPPGCLPWIQAQAFKFQYSSTTPQIINYDATTYTPYYTSVNPTLRIITNCSVANGTLNSVNIKVAKGSAGSNAIPLAADELTAFQFYLNQIKPAGIVYNAISVPADRLKTKATVYYNGAYASVISANLLTAYKNYLNTIPFGGGIKAIDITVALRAVTGVQDVVINEMVARPNSVPFGGGNILVSGNAYNIYPEYTTIAGYIQDEDTAGYDFQSLLTLIAV